MIFIKLEKNQRRMNLGIDYLKEDISIDVEYDLLEIYYRKSREKYQNLKIVWLFILRMLYMLNKTSKIVGN